MPPCIWEERFFWPCGHTNRYSWCLQPHADIYRHHDWFTPENRCTAACPRTLTLVIKRDQCRGCQAGGIRRRPNPLSEEEIRRRRREAAQRCTDMETLIWVDEELAQDSHRQEERRRRDLERAVREARRRDRRTRWEDNLTARRLLELRNQTMRRDRRMFRDYDDDDIFVSVALEDLPENDRECPVCLENYNSRGPMQPIEVPCGHRFHLQCILLALEESRNSRLPGRCPLCRNQPSFLEMPNFDDENFTEDGLSDEARTNISSVAGSPAGEVNGQDENEQRLDDDSGDGDENEIVMGNDWEDRGLDDDDDRNFGDNFM